MENNGSGVQYPTIELGGRIYTVKFSRGLLYRMGKAGVDFAPKLIREEGIAKWQMTFPQIVDYLHLATGFEGSHEELAELVFDQRPQAIEALMLAWGKAFPPPQQVKLREPAGNLEAPVTQ